jgi:hypothetical protein
MVVSVKNAIRASKRLGLEKKPTPPTPPQPSRPPTPPQPTPDRKGIINEGHPPMQPPIPPPRRK